MEYTDEAAAFRRVERFDGFEFVNFRDCPVMVLPRRGANPPAGYIPVSESGDYAVYCHPFFYQNGRETTEEIHETP